jgi:ABC-2 type transport system ATP-binding protein
LVHRPKVVFLDEPTAGVDVALRRDLWAYVRKLRGEGTTIVLTTHYLEEAETLADRVGVIDKGRLVCLDTPRGLLEKHGKRTLQVTLATPIDGLSSLPEILRTTGATLDEARRVLSCPVEGADLSRLLGALAALPVAPTHLQTIQPSLEQVFLELTGGRSS